MYLTPLEIKKQTFSRQVLGYKPEDVHLFLEMVADDVEALVNARIPLESRIGELETEISEFREIERSLRDAMLMASEARDLAEHRAEAIVEDAEGKRKAIIAEGESIQTELLLGANRRRGEIEFEVGYLENQHGFIVEKMRQFLCDQLAVLDDYIAADGEESRPERAENANVRVVSLTKASPEASDDDETSSRGAEAS